MVNYTPSITLIDLGGLDFIEKEGESVAGLYSKLASYARSINPVLYNFYFAGMLMPPTRVIISATSSLVRINGYIEVDSYDYISFVQPTQ